MQKVLSFALLVGALVVTVPSVTQDHARGKEKTYKMVTVVQDFATTKWTLDCVPRGKLDLTQVALNDKGIAAFFDCLNDIESEVGVEIKSRTRVRNGVVQSDKVTSTTTLTADDVEKLKGILEDPDNQEPPFRPVFVISRPRVQTVLCDGEVTEMWITLAPFMTFDVLHSGLSEQQIEAILAWVAELEERLGVELSNTTTVRDGQTEKDRVVAVTYLDDQAMQDTGAFLFEEQNIAVIPNEYVVPATIRGVIKLDEPIDGATKFKFEVEGEIIFRDDHLFNAPPDQIPFPIFVPGMALDGPLQPQLPGPPLMLELPDPLGRPGAALGGGRRPQLLIPPDPLLGGLELQFQALTLSPGPGLQPKPFKIQLPPSKPVRSKVRGKAPLVEDPDGAATERGTLKIQRFELRPPFRNRVRPLAN